MGTLRLGSFRGVGIGCANKSVPFPLPPALRAFFFVGLIGLVLEPTARNMKMAMKMAMNPVSRAVSVEPARFGSPSPPPDGAV